MSLTFNDALEVLKQPIVIASDTRRGKRLLYFVYAEKYVIELNSNQAEEPLVFSAPDKAIERYNEL